MLQLTLGEPWSDRTPSYHVINVYYLNVGLVGPKFRLMTMNNWSFWNFNETCQQRNSYFSPLLSFTENLTTLLIWFFFLLLLLRGPSIIIKFLILPSHYISGVYVQEFSLKGPSLGLRQWIIDTLKPVQGIQGTSSRRVRFIPLIMISRNRFQEP